MILDLFAGMGGWSEGLGSLGHADVGIEMDLAACHTRAAAGHQTIRADVATFPLDRLVGRVEGLIASPPCTDWSQSGKRQGLDGETGALVLEVDRWTRALRPRWVACEQVPPAVEWWHRFAREWAELGYSTWAGVVNAADYGVPQTRKRAILMASRDRTVAPPVATHGRDPHPALFGASIEPWISMATALGWGPPRPAPTICTGKDINGGNRWRQGVARMLHTNRGQDEDGQRQQVPVTAPAPAPALSTKSGGQWVFDRPATTVCGDARIAAPGHRDRAGGEPQFGADTIRLTITDALILQSFRPDYPVTGNKTKQFEQVGNAVPPTLARAVLAQLI